MGQRCYVYDFDYFDACSVYGTDGAFAAVAGTLDIGFYLAQAEVVSYLSTILSGHLSGIGSVLLRTTEAHLAGTRPRNNLAFAVCQRYDDVVKGAVHVELALCANLYISFFSCN